VKLFEIVDQFKALAVLEDSDDIPPEVIADTLEGLEGDFEQKAVAIAKFILSMEAAALDIRAAALAMEHRADRLARRAEAIKHYLHYSMQAINKDKIETPELKIRRQNNPPAVQITDEKKIPEAYWRYPPPPPKEPDKKAIKQALESGITIEGCFIEAGEHLRIQI
jgi:hypothetical protein